MTTALLLALILAAAPPAGGANPALADRARDPFQGPDQARDEGPCEPPGFHCVPWQRMRVTGIVTAPSGALATVDAGNGETFFVKVGDRARNGVVVSIDSERRGVLLREPMPGTVAGFREIVLLTGAEAPIVREPVSAEPALSTER